jgi:hypothetical protein
MMITTQQDFDQAVKQYNLAMSDFFKGNPEPVNNFYSQSDKVSLAQLSGGLVLGRKPVTDTVTRNAIKYQEGKTTFETLMKL